MDPWICMVIIFLAGGLGGVVNALMYGEGLLLPHWKNGIWCPGFIGNAFIGSIAALISWGLNGSGSNIILGVVSSNDSKVPLTIGAFTGAILVGIGGTRWLSNEIDKKLLRQAASEAGKRDIPHEDCDQLQQASPMRTLQMAKSYPPSKVSAYSDKYKE